MAGSPILMGSWTNSAETGTAGWDTGFFSPAVGDVLILKQTYPNGATPALPSGFSNELQRTTVGVARSVVSSTGARQVTGYGMLSGTGGPHSAVLEWWSNAQYTGHREWIDGDGMPELLVSRLHGGSMVSWAVSDIAQQNWNPAYHGTKEEDYFFSTHFALYGYVPTATERDSSVLVGVANGTSTTRSIIGVELAPAASSLETAVGITSLGSTWNKTTGASLALSSWVANPVAGDHLIAFLSADNVSTSLPSLTGVTVSGGTGAVDTPNLYASSAVSASGAAATISLAAVMEVTADFNGTETLTASLTNSVAAKVLAVIRVEDASRPSLYNAGSSATTSPAYAAQTGLLTGDRLLLGTTTEANAAVGSPAGTTSVQAVTTTGGGSAANVALTVYHGAANGSIAAVTISDGSWINFFVLRRAIPVPVHQGAASLSSSSTLSAAGVVTGGVPTHQGVASLSSSSTLSAAGARTATVSASLVSASTLSATAVRGQPAAASLASTSVLTAAATPVRPASVALTSTSTLVAAAAASKAGAAALTSTSAMSISAGGSGQSTETQTSPVTGTWTTFNIPAGTTSVVLEARGGDEFGFGGGLTRGTLAYAGQSIEYRITDPGPADSNMVEIRVDGVLFMTAYGDWDDGSGADWGTATISAAGQLGLTDKTSINGGAATGTGSAQATYTYSSAGVTVTRHGVAELVSTSALAATGTALEMHAGAASLTSSSALNAQAVVSSHAAVELSSTSVLSSAATRSQPAVAALVSSSALAATAVRAQPALAALTSVSTLTVTGAVSRPGAVTLTSTSSLSALGARTAVVAASFVSVSALSSTAAGPAVHAGTAALASSSSLAADGLRTVLGAANLVSASSLTTEGLRTALEVLALEALSVLTVAALREGQASASMTASSTLSVTAVRIVLPAIALSSSSLLTATVVRAQPAASALGSTSTLIVSGIRVQPVAVELTSSSALTGTPFQVLFVGASLISSSSLAATGATAPAGGVSLTSSSTLTAAAVRAALPVATLAATSALSVSAVRVAFGTVVLSSTSTLSTTGLRTVLGAVALTASSTLVAAGIRTMGAQATLTSSSTLTIAGWVTRFPLASLASSSTLLATAGAQAFVSASADLVSTSQLLSTGVRVVPTGAPLVSSSALMVSADRVVLPVAALVALSQLAVAALLERVAEAILEATSELTVGAPQVQHAAAATLVSISELLIGYIATGGNPWHDTFVEILRTELLTTFVEMLDPPLFFVELIERRYFVTDVESSTFYIDQ